MSEREVVVTEEQRAAGFYEYAKCIGHKLDVKLERIYRAMRALEPAPAGGTVQVPQPTEDQKAYVKGLIDWLKQSADDLRDKVLGGPAAAAPAGEWTREPPTEAGWYWVCDDISGTIAPMKLWKLGIDGAQRWSLPIALPPAPGEPMEEP